MSLRDGNKKMSKSEESDYSRINLKDDKDLIDEKVKSLSEASAPLAQKLYEEESQKQSSENEENDPNGESDVVDADFEEVKEEKEQQNS